MVQWCVTCPEGNLDMKIGCLELLQFTVRLFRQWVPGCKINLKHFPVIMTGSSRNLPVKEVFNSHLLLSVIAFEVQLQNVGNHVDL